ncbi:MULTISPECIES: hypothetical protein [Burkholderia]|uniref:Uncharacterized protein n=1 Tax=Burkholderia anthina TaxID=179879 RepID=A0A7T6VF24_9BURK|nr:MULTISPECIES: hypothetical protein [Burkholderia]MBY4870698.1 hypothetical protein [Burkholderia anthina]QQK02624.1 hypothetical protein JFN94_00100 [Burkholderia anthina]
MTSTQKIFKARRKAWHRAKGSAVEQRVDDRDRYAWIAVDIGGTTAFFG